MSFASGSVSFRRYYVSGPFQRKIDDELLHRIEACAFGHYGQADRDGIEVGWVTPRHLFDTSFTEEKVIVGRCLHLAMRLDRTKVPGAVLKSYVEIEQEAAREAGGGAKLTKEDLLQARQAAASRADRERKQGVFRRISASPLLFDLKGGQVYFSNLGNTAHDKLVTLFTDTFGAKLEPAGPAPVASRMLQSAGRHRFFEDAVPCHLIDADDDVCAYASESDAADRSFLGREFLTWLWYRIGVSDGVITVKGGAEIETAIRRELHLSCDFKLTGKDVILQDAPSNAPESRAALAVGKQPAKLGLTLVHRSQAYSLTLDGERFNVTALIPPGSDEDDPAAILEERCSQVRQVQSLLDSMYAEFLSQRTDARWLSELGKMKKWAAAGRLNGKLRQPQLALA